MRGIKKFEEFIKEGVVKVQSPDKSRAEFLAREAGQSYKHLMDSLEKIQLSDENANSYVKMCHDVLMELIRTKMLLRGYNASGYASHEAEVSYLRILGFNERDVQFADQMRYFRNGMLYYGTILDKEYAEKAIVFTKTIYLTLNKIIE